MHEIHNLNECKALYSQPLPSCAGSSVPDSIQKISPGKINKHVLGLYFGACASAVTVLLSVFIGIILFTLVDFFTTGDLESKPIIVLIAVLSVFTGIGTLYFIFKKFSTNTKEV